MVKLAIFASGNGSNFQAIVDAIKNGRLNASCELLISDRPDAKALERAKKANIPAFVFQMKEYAEKTAFEQAILAKLKEYEIDFIALAGYMRLIGPTLLEAYEQKIVNIHPSLLPSFPGLDAIGQAFRAGVKVTWTAAWIRDRSSHKKPWKLLTMRRKKRCAKKFMRLNMRFIRKR